MHVISNEYFNPMALEELMPATLERQCEICRGAFPVDIYSTTRICPECLRRLERMLYPERED